MMTSDLGCDDLFNPLLEIFQGPFTATLKRLLDPSWSNYSNFIATGDLSLAGSKLLLGPLSKPNNLNTGNSLAEKGKQVVDVAATRQISTSTRKPRRKGNTTVAPSKSSVPSLINIHKRAREAEDVCGASNAIWEFRH